METIISNIGHVTNEIQSIEKLLHFENNMVCVNLLVLIKDDKNQHHYFLTMVIIISLIEVQKYRGERALPSGTKNPFQVLVPPTYSLNGIGFHKLSALFASGK